jgi:HEPN/Toprim N-terminal domain 1
MSGRLFLFTSTAERGSNFQLTAVCFSDENALVFIQGRNLKRALRQTAMGTYTELTVAGYPLINSKSAIVPEVMTMFRESDRREFSRRVAERNVLVWGTPDNPDDPEIEWAIEYSCETGEAIDRLNVMGFTIERVKREFDTGRRSEVKKYQSWAEEEAEEEQWFANDWDFMKHLTFDAYSDGFRSVIANGLRPVPFDDHKRQDIDPVARYILGENDEFYFGFPCDDPRFLLRLACEVVERKTRVIQDITDLVFSGYYTRDERVCESAIRSLTARQPENSPRIILTEGSTDAEILKEALALLYPHLFGYYTFLDFNSSRSPGGAGHLVSLIKAFCAAGVANRVIALFDNDTSGHEARRALDSVPLSPNIAILHYPEIPLLRHYPTLGPGGMTSLDVNGLAASIELYLGADTLSEEGTLTPVQWKGYSEVLKQYQGEVMQKPRLYSAYKRKVSRCKSDPVALEAADW